MAVATAFVKTTVMIVDVAKIEELKRIYINQVGKILMKLQLGNPLRIDDDLLTLIDYIKYLEEGCAEKKYLTNYFKNKYC